MPDTVGAIPIVTPHVNTALPSDSHMHVPKAAAREPAPNPVLDPEAKRRKKKADKTLCEGLIFFVFLLAGSYADRQLRWRGLNVSATKGSEQITQSVIAACGIASHVCDFHLCIRMYPRR